MFRSCKAIIISDIKMPHGILSVNIHNTLDPVCLQFTFHALNAKNGHARTHTHVCVCACIHIQSLCVLYSFLNILNYLNKISLNLLCTVHRLHDNYCFNISFVYSSRLHVTGSSFPVLKRADREAVHLRLSSSEVTNGWSYTPHTFSLHSDNCIQLLIMAYNFFSRCKRCL